MKKFKMLWALMRPMLAAAGITKPSDVGKMVAPLVQILHDLRTLEVQQVKQLDEIHESIIALETRRLDILYDQGRSAKARSRLEELLSDRD
jgi:hypothetical protein